MPDLSAQNLERNADFERRLDGLTDIDLLRVFSAAGHAIIDRKLLERRQRTTEELVGELVAGINEWHRVGGA